jgi:hypothetical protein
MVVEVALWLPVLFLLIAGVIQFGKITYLYYTLRKIEYTIARSVSIQSGVNFCPGAGDPIIQGAIEFAVTGTSDGSGTPLVWNLTPAMISVTTECIDPATGLPGPCDTSGCDGAAGRPAARLRGGDHPRRLPGAAAHSVHPAESVPIEAHGGRPLRRRLMRRRRAGLAPARQPSNSPCSTPASSCRSLS